MADKRWHVSYGVPGTDTREYKHVVSATADIALAVARKHGFIDPIATEETYATHCTRDCGYEAVKALHQHGQHDRGKLIDKIKKLMALSASPNEHEALAAAQKAQELLAQHNIDMAEIEKTGQLSAEDMEVVQDASIINPTNGYTWRRSVHVASAHVSFCGYLYTQFYQYGVKGGWGPDRQLHTDRHIYIGRQANVAAAQVMADYLIQTCERLCEESVHLVAPKERATYRNAFLVAAGRRVNIRLTVMRREMSQGATVTATGTNLPALLSLYEQHDKENSEKLKSLYGKKLHKGRGSQTSHDRGYADGDAAGKTINLNKQIGGGRNGQKQIGGAQ